MSLLETHLDQITLCASTLSTLPFPTSKTRPFTSATLLTSDITSLIRDTEAHERALFHLDPSTSASNATHAGRRDTTLNRRATAHDPASGFPSSFSTAGPTNRHAFPGVPAARPGTAVSAVLGGELAARTKRELARAGRAGRGNGPSSEKAADDGTDVGLLLDSAAKLCDAYPLAGARERIERLRVRNEKVVHELDAWEGRVREQGVELERLGRGAGMGMGMFDDEEVDEAAARGLGGSDSRVVDEGPVGPVGEVEVKREEGEIRDLERKKRELERRVEGMEKDLGGLMR